jgi:hypothetical protein
MLDQWRPTNGAHIEKVFTVYKNIVNQNWFAILTAFSKYLNSNTDTPVGKLSKTMFLNRRAAARYNYTGPSSYTKKNLPGRGLTKVENHCTKMFLSSSLRRHTSCESWLSTLIYCNGPLPFNGQLATDIVSVVTNADIVTATTVMHCDWVEAFHR